MKLPQALLSAMQRRAERRMDTPPSKRIGERYLTRWHLLPKNRFFNVYLHHVQEDDPDSHLHDHPWLFNISVVLRGRISETLPSKTRVLEPGSVTARMSRAPHRLDLLSADSLTVFLTGPKIRDWGFYTEKGWVDSQRYLQANGDGRAVSQDYTAR